MLSIVYYDLVTTVRRDVEYNILWFSHIVRRDVEYNILWFSHIVRRDVEYNILSI